MSTFNENKIVVVLSKPYSSCRWNSKGIAVAPLCR